MSNLETLLAQADACLNEGKLEDAIDACRKVIERDPDSFQANYWLFWSLERLALVGLAEVTEENRRLSRWLLEQSEGDPDRSRPRCHALRREALALASSATEIADIQRAMAMVDEILSLWDDAPAYFEAVRLAPHTRDDFWRRATRIRGLRCSTTCCFAT